MWSCRREGNAETGYTVALVDQAVQWRKGQRAPGVRGCSMLKGPHCSKTIDMQ